MSSRQLCHFFNTPRGCKFGEKCKFLHEAAQRTTNQDTRANTSEHNLNKFNTWLYQVPRNSSAPKLGLRLSRFFQQALDLVVGDESERQAVVTKLASEGGLKSIDELVKKVEEAIDGSYESKAAALRNYTLPLFQILAHQDVLSSLVLESSITTIFNFLFGPSGCRSISLFGFTSEVLAEAPNNASQDDWKLDAALESSAVAFTKTMDLNGTAPLVEVFKVILARLLSTLAAMVTVENTQATARAEKFLHRASQRLGCLNDLPAAAGGQQVNLVKPSFKLEKDGPGNLSSQGTRHDNDSEDIRRIQIMPTADEVKSHRSEYLPTTDSQQWHIPGLGGLLDRQFRLLREDTVGQLRDAVKIEIDRLNQLQGTNDADSSRPNYQQAARTYVYNDALLQDLMFHKTRGLDLIYQFGQPGPVRTLSSQKRKEWWQSSKRLQSGGLICLLDRTGSPIFCSVSATGLMDMDGHRDESKEGAKTLKGYNVFDDPEVAFAVLSLVETNGSNLESILHGFMNGPGRGQERIIEFPGILLQSFQPTLKAMQRMSETLDMPFRDLVASEVSGIKAVAQVDPPAYTRLQNFRYDLSCLTADGSNVSFSPGEGFDESLLSSKSTLDHAQTRSIIDALSRKLSLIQGPPGTGKSYTGVSIIKVLLEAQKRASLGPILTVCYTNHALDQLLEHLVGQGVDQIIRIGSRSKSEILKDLNLRNVASKIDRTKTERRKLFGCHEEIAKHLRLLNVLLSEFGRAASSPLIQKYLSRKNRSYYTQLFETGPVDEEGFTRVQYGSIDPLTNWLEGRYKTWNRSPRALEILENISLHEMTSMERQLLYASWVSDLRANKRSQILSVLDHFLSVRAKMEDAHQELNRRCLQQASVIGVTTSGLAQIMKVLQRLNIKVVLCEEAGEVLEAHTLATLLPSIEHAIHIGDHRQLRPHVQNFELSSDNYRGKQYSLDVSLFERLVEARDEEALRLPFTALEIQRRMRPSISSLIRKTSYPILRDHQSVENFPPVCGMHRPVFWLHHKHKEGTPENDKLMSTSYFNQWEVTMVSGIVSHLVSQGVYRPEDVVVLTPYLEQLRRLRQELSRSVAVVVGDRDVADMEINGVSRGVIESEEPLEQTVLSKAVRIATIDNFQGEEALVAVISFVRCNEQLKCGFLRTPNRINVLLSRAKHGMYIVGNAQTARSVPMWDEVIDMFQEGGNLGESLQLKCPRHPDREIEVRAPDDFKVFSPEGGCNLKCDKRLNCGHACINQCHSDALHNLVKCLEPCQRPIQGCETHACPRPCGDKCPTRCYEPIADVLLPCGHEQTLPCWEAKDLNTARCLQPVEHHLKTCGHQIRIECHQSENLDSIKCSSRCGKILSCGHACRRCCSHCREFEESTLIKEDHSTCQETCGRPYTMCRHSCIAKCHGDDRCPPCKKPCEVRCVHSRCKKKCFEPCTPCAEGNCSSQCPHQKCEMPCAVPCNWIPCSRRCEKRLSCGHQCVTVCGEICPSSDFCQICCKAELKETEVDWISFEKYGDVDLDQDPCVIPQCGHVLLMSSMDGHFEMQKHYEMESNGKIIDVIQASPPFSVTDNMKGCPSCRGSLREVSRYGRLVRRAILDESSRRHIEWARRSYLDLEAKVQPVEESLMSDDEERFGGALGPLVLRNSRNAQIDQLAKMIKSSVKRNKSLQLRRDIKSYLTKVRREEQPFQQVWNMVQDVRRRKQVAPKNLPDDIGTVQMRDFLLGTALSLRFDLALLSAAISCWRASYRSALLSDDSNEEVVVDLAQNRQDCENLVVEAEAAKLPATQVEGHLLFMKYAALEISVANISQGVKPKEKAATGGLEERTPSVSYLQEVGLAHLNKAQDTCKDYPGVTSRFGEDLQATEKMLRERFHSHVSSQERRDVLAAMAREFGGTGHWYVPVN